MTSWIEIERVCKDRPAFKALAKRLIADAGFERTVYEETFLRDLSKYKGIVPLDVEIEGAPLLTLSR
jgi:hypothetical protein